jgi:glycosyltransferase involved in cell wall biosynthesis
VSDLNQKPLRVLHVASGDLWGGAEVQLYTLCKYFQRIEGVYVQVVLMNAGELQRRLVAEGITVHVLDESRLTAFKLYRELKRVIREFHPDLVHTHRQKENILASLANWMTVRAESVRTQHGAPEFDYSWKQWPKKLQVALDRFCGNVLQRKIIAVSDELAGKLEQDFARDRIVTIENGVDLEQLQSVKKSGLLLPEDAVHIGIVGRLVPVKRIDLFIEMASLLRCLPHQEHRFRFHVFGDGPLREVLEGQVQRLGLSELLTFHGHKDDVHSYMKALNVLVMCSDHEGLPMTLLEAMALDVPIVAHNAGALKAVFKERVGGILSQGHSAQEYADAVDQVLSKTVVLRKQGSLEVRQSFSAGKNAENVYKLYMELMVA